MSPHFTRKDDGGPGTTTVATQRLQAEIERLEALALPQLAAEVMRTAFTTDYAPDISPLPPTEWIFVPGDLKNTKLDVPPDLSMRLRDLAAEGIQVLEHKRLVRVEAHHFGTSFSHGYLTTRQGREALANGTLEQILAED
jgi:hypothetical protein